MAEERNLGVARAPEADEDTTKAELQRRMEEARESITQTVSEIKETVTNQYQHVRDSVSEALDWREQYRKRPVAWTLGALGVGVVVGYGLGGAVIGGREDDRDYRDYDETDDYDRTDAAASQSAFTDHRSYASHAITGGAYGSSEYAAAAPAPDPAMPPQAHSAPDSRPSYSSGYEQAAVEEEAKPGLMERFKETRAYDRLQEEVGELGNRFMDELATAARTIVLPALFNKIKEMVGVDLSGKQQASATPAARQQTPAPAQQNTQAAAASAETPSPSQGTDESRSKFDQLATEPRAPQGSESGQQRNTGFGYDDRYERESQLYARSENRAFSAPAPRSDSAPNATGAPATDPKDTPGGGNS